MSNCEQEAARQLGKYTDMGAAATSMATDTQRAGNVRTWRPSTACATLRCAQQQRRAPGSLILHRHQLACTSACSTQPILSQ